MPPGENDAPSDWEQGSSSSDKEESQKRQSAAQSSKAPAKKSPSDVPSSTRKQYNLPANLSAPLNDPNAERRRLKLIEEQRDMALGAELFGVENEDDDNSLLEKSLDLRSLANRKDAQSSNKSVPSSASLSMSRLQEVETLCSTLVYEISNSPAKSNVWLRFLDRLLTACSPKMEPQDLKTLEKKVVEAHKKQVQVKNLRATNAKKGSDLKVNTKNIQAELEMYDGLDDSQYSDENQDDYFDDEDPSYPNASNKKADEDFL